MARNYEQAALRHFADAEALAEAGRYDGAGHLIGLAAECALKHGAQGFTVPKNREIDGHLPRVKGEIRRILQGRNTRGQLFAIVGKHGFFADWNVNNRYEADGHVSKPTYEQWRNSTASAFRIVNLRLRSPAAANGNAS